MQKTINDFAFGGAKYKFGSIKFPFALIPASKRLLQFYHCQLMKVMVVNVSFRGDSTSAKNEKNGEHTIDEDLKGKFFPVVG